MVLAVCQQRSPALWQRTAVRRADAASAADEAGGRDGSRLEKVRAAIKAEVTSMNEDISISANENELTPSEALRDSEKRFRMLADNMSQLAWTCDLLGNVTWYNKRWLDYTGLTYEDM